jgi:hypothetical protein
MKLSRDEAVRRGRVPLSNTRQSMESFYGPIYLGGLTERRARRRGLISTISLYDTLSGRRDQALGRGEDEGGDMDMFFCREPPSEILYSLHRMDLVSSQGVLNIVNVGSSSPPRC